LADIQFSLQSTLSVWSSPNLSNWQFAVKFTSTRMPELYNDAATAIMSEHFLIIVKTNKGN